MALERTPQLGTTPVSLTVKLPASKEAGVDSLTNGLRELYRRGEFTDVALLCQQQTFLAHRCVLAGQSEVFKQGLAGRSLSGREEVRLADIANPEAVQLMLAFMYQMDSGEWKQYNPRTQEINKDVLRLAQNFKLPGLTEQATHWLATDVTTGNVVERLAICEEYCLSRLREKIMEQLTFNRVAFREVANCDQIMNHPKLMQELLQMAALAADEPEEPKPAPVTAAPVVVPEPAPVPAPAPAAKKKARKA